MITPLLCPYNKQQGVSLFCLHSFVIFSTLMPTRVEKRKLLVDCLSFLNVSCLKKGQNGALGIFLLLQSQLRVCCDIEGTEVLKTLSWQRLIFPSLFFISDLIFFFLFVFHYFIFYFLNQNLFPGKCFSCFK